MELYPEGCFVLFCFVFKPEGAPHTHTHTVQTSVYEETIWFNNLSKVTEQGDGFWTLHQTKAASAFLGHAAARSNI